MANRGLLRRQLRQAWVEAIQSAYLDQVINSERALQVHLASRLMEIFRIDQIKRRIFVEPMMQLRDGSRVHPDLLICNARSIIGVVELKYQPKKPPQYRKDFATFESLAEHGTDIEIDNRRYRGPEGGGGRFGLAADTLFCWAGVYRGPVQKIPQTLSENIPRSTLLVLHAATRSDDKPELVVMSGQRTASLE